MTKEEHAIGLKICRRLMVWFGTNFREEGAMDNEKSNDHDKVNCVCPECRENKIKQLNSEINNMVEILHFAITEGFDLDEYEKSETVLQSVKDRLWREDLYQSGECNG